MVDIWLENLDNTITIPIFLDYQREPDGLVAVDQLAGIGTLPTEIATYPTPGNPGVNLGEVSYPERDIALPLLLAGDTETEYAEKLDRLRRLTDPNLGGFWLCAALGSSIRRIHLMLRSGLENNPEQDNTAVFILDCIAAQPYVESYQSAEVIFTPFAAVSPFVAEY